MRSPGPRKTNATWSLKHGPGFKSVCVQLEAQAGARQLEGARRVHMKGRWVGWLSKQSIAALRAERQAGRRVGLRGKGWAVDGKPRGSRLTIQLKTQLQGQQNACGNNKTQGPWAENSETVSQTTFPPYKLCRLCD